MKHYKVYLFCLISWLWLLPGHLPAGGGEYYSPFYVDKGFNILPPSLTAQRAYKRSSHHSGTYYSETEAEATELKAFNVLAWSKFLKRSVEESEKIVYEGLLPDDLEPETRDYLNAVRAQEELATLPDQDKKPLYNPAIAQLQSALDKASSDFLRQRYVFLILRLAHYSGQYDKVATLYAQYEKERQQPEAEIGHWIDALYAGALQRKGQRAEAAYRFAQIFQHSKTKKLEAQLNFVIKTDAEWQALLDMCRDNDEKALMHFVRGLKTKANSLQELRAIYQLAPDSPWVDEALVRELEYVQFGKGSLPMPAGAWWQSITTVDHELLIADNRNAPKLLEQSKQRRITYLAELNDIVGTIRADKKRRDLFLSDFAALYLKLLQQQPVSVAEVHDFQAGVADKARLAATKPLEYFVYLENLKAVDAPAEAQISVYLEQLVPLYRVAGEGDEYEYEYGDNRSDFRFNIMDYTYIKLEPLYLKHKADWQPAKTYAAKNRGEVVLDNMLVVELRDFQKLLREEGSQHNLLLQNMLKSMRETNKVYSLDEAVARKYLAADMPEKALAALAAAPPQTPEQLFRTDYNPFNTSLSGNNRQRGSGKTLKELMETLVTLQKQVQANPDDAAAYYLLGTLHYNMSWFGNSPMVLRYYRQTTNWAGGLIDLSRARDYYELALKHSNDRDLTAKVLYALAKIEQVELYTRRVEEGDKGYGDLPDYGASSYKAMVLRQKALGLGKYLGQLKAYEDTDYFRQVISQCADYRYFHSE